MSKNSLLTIGRLAECVGVNVETIRYYQRIGVLAIPAKPSSGYRVYPESDVARLRFIKRAQELGFSLGEVAELLSLGKSNCCEVRQLAEAKLQEITQRIRDFERMRDALGELVTRCQTQLEPDNCPLVAALSEEAG